MKTASEITPKPAETQPSEPTIPITKAELLQLQDVASGLEVLRSIAKSADDMSIIQIEWIINKIAEPLWTLAHDELDGRWGKQNPETPLFERQE